MVMDPIVLGGGQRGLALAGKLDAAGEAIRFGQYSPVRYLAPVFSKATRGAQHAEGQKFAIDLSEDQEQVLIRARERLYEPLTQLERSGVLRGEKALENSNRMLEYLEGIEPPKPDEIKALTRQYDEAEFAINQGVPRAQLTDEQLSKLEGLRQQRHLEYEKAGYDWKPKLTPELEPLRDTLDDLKHVMQEVYQLESSSGVAITKLDDPIEYFARLRQTDQGPMRRARNRNSFAPTDAFTLGRDKSLRGMMRGTAMLQEMSVDPEFAGIAHLKNWNPNVKAEMRKQWRSKYGLVQQGTMFDGDEWQRNTDRLFDKITKLDRAQVERGIPMFATNPAEVALRRLEEGVKAASAARGVRRFLREHARATMDTEEGFVKLSDVFGNAASSSINQGHEPAKQMMIRELGEVAEQARRGIFESRKRQLLRTMVRAQLESFGIDAKQIPDDPEAAERLMLDILAGNRPSVAVDPEMTGIYESADEFFGDDWQADEMAKITSDEILSAVDVPANIAEDAGRVINAFQAPEEVSKLVAVADTITNWFKTNVTATAPSFHTRNAFSGAVQNVLGGAMTPQEVVPRYNDALALLRGKTIKIAEDFARDPVTGEKLKGAAATEQLRREVFAQGILDSPGQHNDLIASAGGRVAQEIPGLAPLSDMFRSPQGTTKLDQFNPFASTGVGSSTDRFFLARWGRGLGNIVEGSNRVSAYIALRKKGFNPDEAARRVKELHVDYTNLTDTERKVLRRAFPFYSFTKGMIPFIARELSNKPGGPLSQTLQAVEGLKDVDARTPQYVAETSSIPLGTLFGAASRWERENIRRRTIEGLALRREKGLPVGSSIIGWKTAGERGNKQWVIDLEARKLAQYCLHKLLLGWSVQQIRTELAANKERHGIKSVPAYNSVTCYAMHAALGFPQVYSKVLRETYSGGSTYFTVASVIEQWELRNADKLASR